MLSSEATKEIHRATPTPDPSPQGGGESRAAAFSRRLAALEELAHAVEGAQDVLGRVGVGDAQVALGEDAEVGAADERDARVVEQRRGERLRLPAGALDVGEGV